MSNLKIIGCILVVCAQLTAQSLDAKIDSLMNLKYKTDGTGAVALVSKKGSIIYNKAFGVANFELNVSMRTEMVFEIASMTKQFTATAILMLEERGKLALTDDINKYLPDYPTKEKITLHNLLNHTSGLSDPGMMEWIGFSCGKREFKPLEYIDWFKNLPPSFKPGEKWEYSNVGYFILGYVIETVSGMKYEEFIQKNIFDPAKMTNSYCQVGNIRELIKNRAYGYDTDQNIYNAEFLYMFQAYSGGCILSTTEDMFKWNNALNTDQLLKKESTAKLFTNYKLNNGENTNYGYGFLLNTVNGSMSYEHGGGAPGFASNGIYLPKEDIYVVILSNCKRNDPEKASIYIAAEVMEKSFAKTEIKVTAEKLKEYVGIYKNPADSTFFEATLGNAGLSIQKKKGNNILGKKYSLVPYGNEQFFAVDKLIDYEFQRNKKGAVTILLVKTRRRMQTDKFEREFTK